MRQRESIQSTVHFPKTRSCAPEGQRGAVRSSIHQHHVQSGQYVNAQQCPKSRLRVPGEREGPFVISVWATTTSENVTVYMGQYSCDNQVFGRGLVGTLSRLPIWPSGHPSSEETQPSTFPRRDHVRRRSEGHIVVRACNNHVQRHSHVSQGERGPSVEMCSVYARQSRRQTRLCVAEEGEVAVQGPSSQLSIRRRGRVRQRSERRHSVVRACKQPRPKTWAHVQQCLRTRRRVPEEREEAVCSDAVRGRGTVRRPCIQQPHPKTWPYAQR